MVFRDRGLVIEEKTNFLDFETNQIKQKPCASNTFQRDGHQKSANSLSKNMGKST
jgi:hypothetical protein